MLFKNVRRTFQKRFLQLIGIGFMVLLSSLFYTSMNYSLDGLKDPTFKFFTEANQEDFSIDIYPFLMEDEFEYVMNNCGIYEYFDLNTLKQVNSACYKSVMDRRINAIESEYSFELELREFKQVSSNTHKYYFMNDMKEINKSYFEEGKKPTTGEIALTPYYAKSNNLEIGDTITIQNVEYKISGYVLFPDYTLPMIGQSFLIDNTLQSFALLEDSEYDNLKYEALHYYISGTGDVGKLKDLLDSDIDFIINATKTEYQLRSGGIYTEIKSGKAFAVGISLVIATISILVIGMIVNRIIQKERNQIGLLKAIGYTNREITKPYLILLTIVSLPMLLLGYFIGLYVALPFRNIFNKFYLLPEAPIEQSLSVVIVSVVLPLTFILVLVYFLINYLLRATPLEMMSPKRIAVNKYMVKLTKYFKKFDIKTRFKYSMVFQSMGKFIVFIFGILFATMMLTYSFASVGIFDKMIFDYYENVEYEYEGYCEYQGCPEVEGEYTLLIPNASHEEQVVSILGLAKDNELHKLHDKRNNEITIELNEDEVIISEYMKRLLGIKVGETIEIKAQEKTFDVKVVDVADIFTGSYVYMDKAYLNKILDLDEEYSNKVYSKSALNVDDFAAVVVKEDVLGQALMMSEFMNISLTMMVVFSGVIGFIILYVILSLTIEDNFYTISLLKVMGFNKKEVNNMVINSYLIYSIIVYILSIPVAYGLLKLMEVMLVRYFNMVMPFELSLFYCILGLIIVVIMYLLGTIDAKRKIQKISLQESLKMYQE